MKFNLNLSERFIFLGLLPKENNFATLKIIRTASKDVGITDDEFEEFDIKRLPPTPENPSGSFSWDPEKGLIEKEFEIGEIAEQLIITELEKLDKEDKLPSDYLSIYEKFIKWFRKLYKQEHPILIMEFKPKKVICLLKGDSFKYTCKNIHLDSQGHEVNNTYRFNKGVAYLVKNQEDYDELIAQDMFEAYDPEEKEVTVDPTDDYVPQEEYSETKDTVPEVE